MEERISDYAFEFALRELFRYYGALFMDLIDMEDMMVWKYDSVGLCKAV